MKYAILMLTYNGLDAVQRCFDSLADTLARPDVMTWVLDNGSAPEVQDYLCELQRSVKINVTLTLVNSGVAGGRAKLIQMLRETHCFNDCEYIVFLDSDTVISAPDWLDRLGGFLDEHDDVGMVGPGGSFALSDFSQFTAAIPNAQCDVVAGFCQMFRRSLLDVGLRMNVTDYAGFWAEDSDFCMQIRALGWDVWCLPVGVQHYPSHSGYGQDMTLHTEHLATFRAHWQGQGLTRAEGAY